MVRKSFLVILISLFAVSILLAGCSSENNERGSDGLPANIVKSDVPAQTTVPVKTVPTQTTAPVVKPVSVVDKALDTNTAASNDTVAIGSLI